jgi:hypothetical protein
MKIFIFSYLLMFISYSAQAQAASVSITSVKCSVEKGNELSSEMSSLPATLSNATIAAECMRINWDGHSFLSVQYYTAIRSTVKDEGETVRFHDIFQLNGDAWDNVLSDSVEQYKVSWLIDKKTNALTLTNMRGKVEIDSYNWSETKRRFVPVIYQ